MQWGLEFPSWVDLLRATADVPTSLQGVLHSAYLLKDPAQP